MLEIGHAVAEAVAGVIENDRALLAGRRTQERDRFVARCSARRFGRPEQITPATDGMSRPSAISEQFAEDLHFAGRERRDQLAPFVGGVSPSRCLALNPGARKTRATMRLCVDGGAERNRGRPVEVLAIFHQGVGQDRARHSCAVASSPSA